SRLADRLEERKVTDVIDEGDAAFIEAADMLFLATADEQGRPNCSYNGGDPGFVRVLDERTIAFPIYDGNGMFHSAGNLLVHPARSACCSSLSSASAGCGSTATRASTRPTRCSRATRRRRWW